MTPEREAEILALVKSSKTGVEAWQKVLRHSPDMTCSALYGILTTDIDEDVLAWLVKTLTDASDEYGTNKLSGVFAPA